jgi:histidinol-phosphate aminotransferase
MTMRMKKDPAALIRPALKELVPYHLDRYDVPVKLDQNENTLGCLEVVRRELIASLETAPLNRYPTPGQPEILEMLSNANDWPEAGILVGNGSDELLHDLALGFLEAGRTSVAPTPSFFVYAYTTRLMGAECIEVSLTPGMEYDLDRLLDAIEAHHPTVVYLCSPNNPTGSVLAPEAIEAVLDRAPGIVALDEAYWEFASWNGRRLLDSFPNLAIFRTFSKAFAMAGIRLGYVLTAPAVAAELRKVQQPYPLNRLSQEAARATLRHADLARERAGEIARTRDGLYRRLAALAGVEVFPSRANFLLFRTRLGARRTFEGLVERGVLVRDVSGHPLLREMLRVGVGTPEENETFFRALHETLQAPEVTR